MTNCAETLVFLKDYLVENNRCALESENNLRIMGQYLGNHSLEFFFGIKFTERLEH